MSSKLMVTYFDKWLAKNIDRFKYRPIKIGFNSYRFDGINKSIVLQITRDIREVTILYYSPNMLNTDNYNCEYDMRDINWFDRVKHIRDKGYCDLGWLEEYKKDRYYPTFKELVETELFEPLIKFCDTYFVKDNHYYIVENCQSVFMGLIGDSSHEKKLKELEEINKEVYKFTLFEN